MPTQKQIAANRSNAQLSTGPRTEQGKAISRMNALKTGIDARNEAASGESPAVLAALSDEYDHEFQPIGLVERFLVDILIKDDWFLRRYRFLAADLVNHGAAVAYESKRGADFGAGFANNTESFNRLHRHIIDTERSFFTHLGELERRQALRRQHQPDVYSSVTDSPEAENPGIGFVSQPTQNPDPARPDSAVSQPVAQPATQHDPTTPPAVTRSPQTPGPSFGFVPHTTPAASAQSPSALPIGAAPVLPGSLTANEYTVRHAVPAGAGVVPGTASEGRHPSVANRLPHSPGGVALARQPKPRGEL
jgi:hypothetical protein